MIEWPRVRLGIAVESAVRRCIAERQTYNKHIRKKVDGIRRNTHISGPYRPASLPPQAAVVWLEEDSI